MSDDQRLYGLPGAEQMYFTAAEVYECAIDGQDDATSWTVEEWTTRSPISTVPPAEAIVEHVLEYTCDDDYPECPWGDDHPVEDPELLALAEKIRERVAATLGSYRLAKEQVATHTITLVEGEDPKYPTVLLDGEPMYVPRQPDLTDLKAAYADSVIDHFGTDDFIPYTGHDAGYTGPGSVASIGHDLQEP